MAELSFLNANGNIKKIDLENYNIIYSLLDDIIFTSNLSFWTCAQSQLLYVQIKSNGYKVLSYT